MDQIDELLTYTFDYLMQMALAMIPDTMDKREGSIIYDALAPACYQIAEFYLELWQAYQNTFVGTAEGEYLDLKAAERGIARNPATPARKRLDAQDDEGNPVEGIETGSRFSTPNDSEPLIYAVVEPYVETIAAVTGAYVVECETPGVAGNNYAGEVLSLQNIAGLATATVSTLLTPGQDVEDDDSFKERFYNDVKQQSYGGNRSEYREWVLGIAGVGDCQIYPVWDGGGTVKVSIVDAQHNPCSTEFITRVKNALDPEPYGTGLGLAPIGHTVTVVTPTEVTTDVKVTLTLGAGYQKQDVESEVIKQVKAQIEEVKKQWGNYDKTTWAYSVVLYTARLISSIVSIQGIINVPSIKINTLEQDLTYTQNATTQELPKVGEVTVIVPE